VDGNQVHNIARLTSISRSRGFIRRKVHGIEDVTENVIPARGKKAKSGVMNPFKPHPVAKTSDFRFALAGPDLSP
jgi:hypothetical protein